MCLACIATCLHPLQVVAFCVIYCVEYTRQYLYFKPRMSGGKRKTRGTQLIVFVGYLGYLCWTYRQIGLGMELSSVGDLLYSTITYR